MSALLWWKYAPWNGDDWWRPHCRDSKTLAGELLVSGWTVQCVLCKRDCKLDKLSRYWSTVARMCPINFSNFERFVWLERGHLGWPQSRLDTKLTRRTGYMSAGRASWMFARRFLDRVKGVLEPTLARRVYSDVTELNWTDQRERASPVRLLVSELLKPRYIKQTYHIVSLFFAQTRSAMGQP